jgi:hypothetical protein
MGGVVACCWGSSSSLTAFSELVKEVNSLSIIEEALYDGYESFQTAEALLFIPRRVG